VLSQQAHQLAAAGDEVGLATGDSKRLRDISDLPFDLAI